MKKVKETISDTLQWSVYILGFVIGYILAMFGYNIHDNKKW